MDSVNKRKKVIDLKNKRIAWIIHMLSDFYPQLINILGITYVNLLFPHVSKKSYPQSVYHI